MPKASLLPTETSFGLTDFLVKIKQGGSGDVKVLLSDFLNDVFAWQTWTPVFTNLNTGTSPTIVSKYMPLGKIVFYTLAVTLGTSPTMGSSPTFSLPLIADTYWASTNGNGRSIGESGYAVSSAGTVWLGRVQIASTTTAVMIIDSVSGGAVQFGGINSTTPFTWVAGSVIDIQGWYKAA